MHFDQQSVSELDPNWSDEGEPILHCAIRKGRFHIVKLLLERGADPYRTDRDGLTALQVARGSDNKEMELLLQPYL